MLSIHVSTRHVLLLSYRIVGTCICCGLRKHEGFLESIQIDTTERLQMNNTFSPLITLLILL